MEINTGSAFASAAIAAAIGFGTTFYVASKVNKSFTRKWSRTLNHMAAASAGYGLTAVINEILGWLFISLPIRQSHIAVIAIANIVTVPGILMLIARLIQSRSKIGSSDSKTKNKTFDREHVGEIEDECWEAAARELDGVRNQAIWARAFSEAHGDESKARAIYIGLRASRIQLEKSVSGSGGTSVSNALIASGSTDDKVSRERRVESVAIAILVLLLGTYLIKEFVKTPTPKDQPDFESSGDKYWEDGGIKYRLGTLYKRTSGALECDEILESGSFKARISGDKITIGNRPPLSISERTPETIFFYGETSDGKSSARVDVDGFIDLRDGTGQLTAKNISKNSGPTLYIFKCREQ